MILRRYDTQVHESFRSENILFFAPDRSDAQICTEEKVDLTQPWIFGFEFSRPNDFFSAGTIDTCPDRDVYRHPERQGQPLTTFKKIHDIYALGIVLLEIGKPDLSSLKHIFPTPQDTSRNLCVSRGLAACCYAGEEPVFLCPRFSRTSLRNHGTFDKARSKASRETDGCEISRHRLEMHQRKLWSRQ